METPHLQVFSRGCQKLQHQPEVAVPPLAILTPPEGASVLLKAVEVGGEHTH